MIFAFSTEQEEFRRTVRAFLVQKSPESEVRRLMDSEPGYDDAVWRQMAGQLGLPGLLIPEEFGGSGCSFVELGIVLEEMGRAQLCAPFFSTAVLAANLLLGLDDDSASKGHLRGIAAGETIATVALTEDCGSWEESAITAAATRGSSGWKINGHKSFVLDGHIADLIIVAARTANGVSLFAVDGDATGLTRVPLATMDQTRRLARLQLDDTPATLLGIEGRGWPHLERLLDLAAVALAAEQVGGAQFVLEMTAGYAMDRVQFGRTIGSFQAIKHKLADMLMAVESAKSAAYYAAWCAAQDNTTLAVAASLAKSYCSEAFSHTATECIQIHGGIGFTWEHPAHLYFKRAKSSELLFGHPVHHRERLAKLLEISGSRLRQAHGTTPRCTRRRRSW